MARHVGSPRSKKAPPPPVRLTRQSTLIARLFEYEKHTIATHAHCQSRSVGRQAISSAVFAAQEHAKTCPACAAKLAIEVG